MDKNVNKDLKKERLGPGYYEITDYNYLKIKKTIIDDIPRFQQNLTI